MGPLATKKAELEKIYEEEEQERIAELQEIGADINETEEEREEERRALAHYAKKREQSRKYYRLNPDKCKQYNKKRVNKAKTADGVAAEPKEKMTKEEKAIKAREYAKKKYHENKEQNALRQKAYRLKYKIAYNRYMQKEKARKAALTPEQRAAEEAADKAAEEQSENASETSESPTEGSQSSSESEEESLPVTPEVLVIKVSKPAAKKVKIVEVPPVLEAEAQPKPSKKRKTELDALIA